MFEGIEWEIDASKDREFSIIRRGVSPILSMILKVSSSTIQ